MNTAWCSHARPITIHNNIPQTSLISSPAPPTPNAATTNLPKHIVASRPLLLSKMARTAFVALVVSMLGMANSLEVITPSQGLTVVADRTYTVEWTGTGSDNRYEIDLYYCGSYCMEDDCGEWVTALCPYGETGCPDNEGDYDIVMPEPMSGTSGSGYKVRVMDVDDESSMDCSDDFTLLASSAAPSVGDADGPYLKVTSPETGDLAYAGEEYTVEFDYDNGVGSKVDRFSIDLYKADGGSGDCGTFVTSVCDKSSIGCKDSMGDYDIDIPEDTAGGEYKIRVGRFEDSALFGCSGKFDIVASGGDDSSSDDEDMSMSYTF